jgi:hypothetical protein
LAIPTPSESAIKPESQFFATQSPAFNAGLSIDASGLPWITTRRLTRDIPFTITSN